MKFWISLCVFVCPGFLRIPAQIQLEDLVMEEVNVEPPQGENGVEGPEGEDHGTSRREGRTSDQLSFLNGDALSGEMVSAEADEGLSWTHPHVKEPIRFAWAPLGEVKLKGPFPVGELEGLARVRISNGDEYRGRILSMDGETLRLETPYAGEVSLAVPMIVSLEPRATSAGIYRGPNDLEEWTASRSGEHTGWALRKNALYYEGNSNETLGRRFEDLPDRAEIAFDLAWRGNLRFYVNLWAEDTKNNNESYSVMLQNGYVRCYRHSNDHGRQDLGNAQVQSLSRLSEARVRLLLNREAKELTLIINGELVKRWKDHFDGEIAGDALQFRASGNTPVKIEHLVVRKWDGNFGEEEGPNAEDVDLLILGNGDLFSGEVLGIANEILRFKTDFAELPIPLDRIAEVDLAMADRAEPRRRAGDVRVVFPTEERVTLELASWKEGRLRGRSETTGEVTLQTRFVSRLTLNPYEERGESDDEAW